MPIVNSEDQVVGKVSELDLIRALMEGKDLKETEAGELMQRCPVVVNEETPLEEVASYMMQLHLFRIPVVDEENRLVGTITRHDLLRLWDKFGTTVLMVTHDVEEALLLSDRVVMMTQGPAATIGRIVSIPFRQPGYQHWKSEIFEFLYGEGAARRSGAGSPSAGAALLASTAGQKRGAS